MLSQAPIVPCLPATDITRAKKFYKEKLGLKESKAQEPGGATFDCGDGTKLYIYPRGPVKIDHTQASFMVADIEAEMKDLRARGVVFEEYDLPGLKTENGIVNFDGFKSSWFKDSEGNILAIGQMPK
ncbi:MAG: VOC family protein [Candidatus Doudnabacteria bacterium]